MNKKLVLCGIAELRRSGRPVHKQEKTTLIHQGIWVAEKDVGNLGVLILAESPKSANLRFKVFIQGHYRADMQLKEY